MQPLPILFLGDGPTLHTGLARIGRHLAANLSRDPRFRVGYLGRGGQVSRKLPFQQYVFQPTAEDEWGAGSLADVVHDFCPPGDGPMVLFTVWDPSRVTWIGARDWSKGEDEALDAVLFDPRIRKWGYFAIDGEGAGLENTGTNPLTGFLCQTLAGYDRVLAYTKQGRDVIAASLAKVRGSETFDRLTHLPHGISLSKFKPRSQEVARASLSIPPESFVVGCVMTNQPRKDWGLWARIGAELRKTCPDLHLLAKVDSLDRYWDLRALCEDLQLGDYVTFVLDDVSDEKMSWFYSACDITILPSLGEGFGYPIVESLACGVPVVTGEYFPGIGGALRTHVIGIPEISLRVDTRWNIMRPLYNPEDWALRISKFKQRYPPRGTTTWRDWQMGFVRSVEHFDWKILWPQWLAWFEAALGVETPSEVAEVEVTNV